MLFVAKWCYTLQLLKQLRRVLDSIGWTAHTIFGINLLYTRIYCNILIFWVPSLSTPSPPPPSNFTLVAHLDRNPRSHSIWWSDIQCVYPITLVLRLWQTSQPILPPPPPVPKVKPEDGCPKPEYFSTHYLLKRKIFTAPHESAWLCIMGLRSSISELGSSQHENLLMHYTQRVSQ